MRHKIVIVDDETAIRSLLKDHFEAEGYLAYAAGNAQEAMKLLAEEPDILLLDINMPGTDGLELCRSIREYVSCPILFLTARIEEQDRVDGLRAGGDDYIVKPFGIDELTARVEAHLRREERSHRQGNMRFSDGLFIDYDKRTVFYQNVEIPLSRKEFDLVEFLSRNEGIVFGRERIYETIWGYDAEGDSIVVKEHIRRLRKRLLEATKRDYIETVWGVGYKWVRS